MFAAIRRASSRVSSLAAMSALPPKADIVGRGGHVRCVAPNLEEWAGAVGRLEQCAKLLGRYQNAPRPSYADQVLSFYRNLGVEPNVAFEVRQPWTALGLVAAGLGIALVPSSVRRLGRDDIEYLILDEPEISSPIIMSCRTNDRSPLLAHFLKLLDEFDEWTETKVAEFS
jgi:DNA-binding transcriptional LysR family regulator